MPSKSAAQAFNDVPTNYWAFTFIDTLVANGITSGCGGGNYCPSDAVTRAQMAVFLERSMNGGSFRPPAAVGDVFLDVGSGDFAASFIEQLFHDGITGGCGNGNFCPATVVSRAQMAVFLLRAKYGSSYSPPAATAVFDDVPANYWAASWIEQLASENITAGCGSGNYCPESPVTRDQIAVFLVRTFDLPPRPQNAPTITVVSPRHAGLTDASSYTFRGSASDVDDDIVLSIDFRNSSGTVVATTTVTNGDWEQSVPLEPGQNEITLEAVDSRGAVGTTTATLTRELFLNTTESPILDASTDTVYLLSPTINGSAPLAVVSIDLATGTRRILSGEGIGAGPALNRTNLMIRDEATGGLIVFNSSPPVALTVDSQSGDRALLAELSSIDVASSAQVYGAVVDEANNRVVLMNRKYGLWSISLADGSLTEIGTPNSQSLIGAPRRGLAISSDGALVYIHTGPVIAEVDTNTLAVREFALDDPPDSTTYHLLDEGRNRVVYSHQQTIISVDLETGANQLLVEVPDEQGLPSFISPGRSADELLMIPRFDDRLVAMNIVLNTYEHLAGSFLGSGPELDISEIAYNPDDGFLYSARTEWGATPADSKWYLMRVDTETGIRTQALVDVGIPIESASNAGLANDADGKLIWFSTWGPRGLFRLDPATAVGQLLVPADLALRISHELCYDASAGIGYVAESGQGSDVYALDTNSAMLSVFSSEALGIGSGPSPQSPYGLACDLTNARVLIGDQLTATAGVYAIDFVSGDRSILSDANTGSGVEYLRPKVLAVSPDGSEAYVLDYGNGDLLRVDLGNGDRSSVYRGSRRPVARDIALAGDDLAFIVDTLFQAWVVDLRTGEVLLLSR